MTGIVAIASDHGGFELKELLVKKMQDDGYNVLDLGTNSTQSVDYPDYAAAMAEALKDGRAERGILLCGTGIGISIAANRYPFIRAALVHDAFGARLCREHNDANVLVLGGRTTGIEIACDCVRLFLTTPFAGDRHARRVGKLSHMC
ncbi:MAG: ribose 5-phosphate isomerase B [Alphaproteobacteria bacterium]|jgi:ribose 5-phosphate isomerase B